MKPSSLLSLMAIAGLSLTAFGITTNNDGDTCSSSTAQVAKKDIIETALAAGNFKTLATALTSAKLVKTLQGKGPFTVFAPTDEAFARIPKETLASLLEPKNRDMLTNILTYHVVPGRVSAKQVIKLDNAAAVNGQRLPILVSDSGVSVAGSKVVVTDIECSNGIIHVIDTVMMPATKDIIGTAVAAGSFKTLAAALEAGGLIEALQAEGPFTVFAPSDAAFAALPQGTVESLLKPEGLDALVSILKYHVVPGRIYADQLKAGTVKTLQGGSLEVKISEQGVFFNESKVTAADIETTNGVIHVIDKVLLP
jgi:uncharacterized surface protein with fasciclin (FAS1) repeats